jgi:protein-tyrosine-phosphatase
MIVFICDNNACHSPMAEAIFYHVYPNYAVQSAGRYASYVRNEVRQVLEEEGISSAGIHSKEAVAVFWDDVELVVQLCQDEDAPFSPTRIPIRKWFLPDPLSAPPEERLEACRALRDELLRRISLLEIEFKG